MAREGNALYAASDFRGAVEKYRDAAELDPETPNVHLNLGYALFQLYRPESSDELARGAAREAAAAFERHLSQSPGDVKAETFRINTLLRAAPTDSAMADEAFALFASMLRENPRDAEARQHLVSLFVDTKRYEQAVAFFAPSLNGGPEDLVTMKVLATIADRSDRVEEAIRWYARRADLGVGAARATLLYELGTYVWNVLHFRPNETSGAFGLRFADLGLRALFEALELQPDSREAAIYANLLYLERAAREPSPFGRETDQRLAFELRARAGALASKDVTRQDPSKKGDGGDRSDDDPSSEGDSPSE